MLLDSTVLEGLVAVALGFFTNFFTEILKFAVAKMLLCAIAEPAAAPGPDHTGSVIFALLESAIRLLRPMCRTKLFVLNSRGGGTINLLVPHFLLLRL